MKKLVTVVAASLLITACSATPKNASRELPGTAATTNSVATSSPSQMELDAQKLVTQMELLQKDSVYFDFDKFAVKSEFRAALRHEADWMRDHPNDTVTLEGNTDNRGSTEYNLALGSERTHAVHKILVTLGVLPARIKDVSLGEAKPRANCEEEKCWKENRRVDFVHQVN